MCGRCAAVRVTRVEGVRRLAELSRYDERGKLGLPVLERAPRTAERKRGQCTCGVLLPRELAGGSGEADGQVLDRWVVADQHHRFDLVRHATQALEQPVRRRFIQLAFDPNLIAWRDAIESLTRPPRRGAKDQRDRYPFLAQVAADQLCRFAPAWREWAIVVGQRRIVPARLGMTQQKQAPRLSHR